MSKGFVAENGTFVTEELMDAWEKAYSRGETPEGYTMESKVYRGRPKLFDCEMASITIRLPRAQKNALEQEAAERGMTFSGYVRQILDSREVS